MAIAGENKERSDITTALLPSRPLSLFSNLSMNAAAGRVVVPVADPQNAPLVPAAAAAAADMPNVTEKQPDLSVSQRGDAETQVDASQSQLESRSEECRLLFHLPPDEVLVQDFNCALQENFLLQGHMYLFVHHICFYSNIFGFETKKIIPFNEVTCVRKAKTAAIFHNAIEIVAGERKHFFTSFFFRDDAYRLIVDGWSQHNSCSQAIIDRQESKPDTGGSENGLVLVERPPKSLKHSASEMCCTVRDDDTCVSTESRLSSKSENNLGASISESCKNGEEKAEGGAEPSSSLEPFTWKVGDAVAPKIPECYTMVAEENFQIRVEEFFNHFFSDEAVNFYEAFHGRCGDKDFVCTSWKEDEQSLYTRNLSFKHPVKLYLGARFGDCREVQQFQIYRNSHLVIKTSQEVSDVPYADYFCVQGIWDVEDNSNRNDCCILKVYVNVAFSKKTIWKGKIEQSTIDECREAYAIWISSAHELLKKKHHLVKPEVNVISRDALDAVQNVGRANSLELKEYSESARTLKIAPSAMYGRDGFTTDTAHPSKGDSGVEASRSLLRESWASFCLYLKNQNGFSVMVVIAFVFIFLLMQLTIIVLLIRTPEVHLISQGNSRDGPVPDGTVALAWLERRAHHLQGEMLMVETQLERMRHEYMLLKTHLQSLEKFKWRS